MIPDGAPVEDLPPGATAFEPDLTEGQRNRLEQIQVRLAVDTAQWKAIADMTEHPGWKEYTGIMQEELTRCETKILKEKDPIVFYRLQAQIAMIQRWMNVRTEAGNHLAELREEHRRLFEKPDGDAKET